jgi:hypothetical protein
MKWGGFPGLRCAPPWATFMFSLRETGRRSPGLKPGGRFCWVFRGLKPPAPSVSALGRAAGAKARSHFLWRFRHD